MNSFAKEPFIPFWDIRVVQMRVHVDSSQVPGPHDPAPETQRPHTLRTPLTLPSPAGRSVPRPASLRGAPLPGSTRATTAQDSGGCGHRPTLSLCDTAKAGTFLGALRCGFQQ